jgi:hypothetical protein
MKDGQDADAVHDNELGVSKAGPSTANGDDVSEEDDSEEDEFDDTEDEDDADIFGAERSFVRFVDDWSFLEEEVKSNRREVAS